MDFIWNVLDKFFSEWKCYMSYLLVTLFLWFDYYQDLPLWMSILVVIALMIYPTFYNINKSGVWKGIAYELLQVTIFVIVGACLVYLLLKVLMIIGAIILIFSFGGCDSSEEAPYGEKEVRVINRDTYSRITLYHCSGDYYRDYHGNSDYYRIDRDIFKDSKGNVYRKC